MPIRTTASVTVERLRALDDDGRVLCATPSDPHPYWSDRPNYTFDVVVATPHDFLRSIGLDDWDGLDPAMEIALPVEIPDAQPTQFELNRDRREQAELYESFVLHTGRPRGAPTGNRNAAKERPGLMVRVYLNADDRAIIEAEIERREQRVPADSEIDKAIGDYARELLKRAVRDVARAQETNDAPIIV